MRIRIHPWHWVVGLLLFCLGALAFVYWRRSNGGDTPAQLVGFLPRQNATIIYLDIAAMRRGGFLNQLSGTPTAEEADYQDFVNRIHFDYRSNLDVVAASFRGEDRFFVLRGRFDWSALIHYVNHQAGSCGNGFCQLAGSQPDRKISFYALRRDLMALAVSPNPTAAYRIHSPEIPLQLTVPTTPAWLIIPADVLESSDLIPARVRPFTSPLHDAQQIVFTLAADGKDLALTSYVTCRNEAAASALEGQLEEAVSALRGERDRRDNLAGVLRAGTFHRQNKDVVGQWPVPHEFIEAVTTGNAN